MIKSPHLVSVNYLTWNATDNLFIWTWKLCLRQWVS